MEREALVSMVESVNDAVAAADHLTSSDQASVDLALHLATIIDEARESGDPDAISKTSFGPMPTLNKVLTGLGLNPEGKQKLGLLVLDEEVEPF
ncbi:hypothetical protein ACUXOC_000261 [Corynebacterium mucifaciens]